MRGPYPSRDELVAGGPRRTGSHAGPPAGGGRRPQGGRPPGGRPPGKGRKRSRAKGMTGIVVAVTASGLAISTGVAIDRFLLPELRSERTSASGPDTRPSTVIPPGPQSDPSTTPETAGAGGARPSSAPAPTADVQTPPLKAMRDPSRPTAEPSKSGEPPASSSKPSSGGTSSGGSGGSSTGSSGAETAVVSLTNSERAKAGCKPLHIDQRLVTSARKHSADMAANNYFSHTSQNGDSPWKRMEAAGYPSPGAENIAKGYPTPAAVMEGWMNSPGHRANILNCDLRAIGVGKASGSGGPLWTQNFGWK
ncbi:MULTISPECIES: CAP domain-containing protein [unclassified Spirillospora]|uniref:CAP domain-containing protein n=1 Tax=unclassified Spirillospora TaxID=2642701 RepID=UPI00371DEF9D